MANLTGKPRADYVQHMFARLAEHYDRTNRWMSWGQDVKWRKRVLDLAALPPGGNLLDTGTGTGDLVLEAVRKDRSISAIGLDFTVEMMQQAKKRQGSNLVGWVNGDALELPFETGFFDAVVCGYLLRNVIDIDKAVAEQYRVLKRNGRLVCLDTTPLPEDVWHMPARVYVRRIIPLIGRAVSSAGNAYKYLPQSTEGFLTAEALAECMVKAGFRDVAYQRLMGGAMAIHWGVKQD